jgi:hypothetical protein
MGSNVTVKAATETYNCGWSFHFDRSKKRGIHRLVRAGDRTNRIIATSER